MTDESTVAELSSTPNTLAEPSNSPLTLLFVDDETNILSSLRRLFRPHGYRIFTADSGAKGLEVIEQEQIDLVVSDMRMPEMDGARFLTKVRERSPDTVRILLTGYADMSSTIAAINDGQIYRYVNKPWEDNDIVLIVRQALENKLLLQEKARLEKLTQLQNEQLRDLNANLEQKVVERTEEVRQTMKFLELAHEKLKKSFLTSVRIFSNLIELRSSESAGHSRRVADLARQLATKLKVSDAQIQDILFAALLHDIGKISLPDKLINKPFVAMGSEDRIAFVKHPIKGEAALMGLDQLQNAAKLIRSHRERYDGLGQPDGLSGDQIPLGARILAVVNDYDALQLGWIVEQKLNTIEALKYIQKFSGKFYQPEVVTAFVDMLNSDKPKVAELALASHQLVVGMTLTRDLVNEDGILLLAKEYELDLTKIDHIRNFERLSKKHLTIYVNAPQ